jgi:hypothetical protein
MFIRHPSRISKTKAMSSLSYFKNKGDGTFATAIQYTVGAYPRDIVAEDLNHDGHPDLAVSNGNSSQLAVLLNTGSGGFGTPTFYSTGVHPSGVTAADFNGDTHVDIAVGITGMVGKSALEDEWLLGLSNVDMQEVDTGTVDLFFNDGTGNFLPAVDFKSGRFPNAVYPIDYNNDGYMGLIVGNYYSQNITIHEDIGLGQCTIAEIFDVGIGVWDIEMGDIDDDGDDDIVVVGNYYYAAIIYCDGVGSYRMGNRFYINGDTGLELRDMNLDGLLDIAVSYYCGRAACHLNLGDGAFGPPIPFGPYGCTWDIASEDFDGDGDYDIALANYKSTTVSYFSNEMK